ncbi:hypothetical protein RLEG3_03470 (plasmid) [Rhizobium leguminosarum bv. trifolii WSM1689]|nr:hypothetical protein RLEG3_03470 [Rhizobium leguminosarum bv. trifolii WSM1689]
MKKRCQFRDADLVGARLILDLTNGVASTRPASTSSWISSISFTVFA